MSNQNYSKRRMGVSVALFLGTLLTILLVGSQSPFGLSFTKSKADTLQKVNTKIIYYQNNYTYKRHFIGQVEAQQSSMIGFEVGGMLQSISFNEGDLVKKGDILAQLDTARLDARKKEVEAALVKAEVDAKLAASTFDRISDAREANAVSAQEKDEAQKAKEAANAAKAIVQAQLERTLVDIEKSKLIAPFDGVLIMRALDEGTVISPGQPIMKVQQNTHYDVRIGVTNKVAIAIKKGYNKTVTINSKEYSATVKAILPVRESSRTIDVILELDQSHQELHPGDVARLPIAYVVDQRGFWVPLTALKEGQKGLWSLYVLHQKDKHLITQRRTVEVHYTDGDRAYISGSVDEGETVVIDGASKLVPEQQVKILGAASSGQ